MRLDYQQQLEEQEHQQKEESWKEWSKRFWRIQDEHRREILKIFRKGWSNGDDASR